MSKRVNPVSVMLVLRLLIKLLWLVDVRAALVAEVSTTWTLLGIIEPTMCPVALLLAPFVSMLMVDGLAALTIYYRMYDRDHLVDRLLFMYKEERESYPRSDRRRTPLRRWEKHLQAGGSPYVLSLP